MVFTVSEEDDRIHVEVSPAAGTMVQIVAQRVAQGGVALIADYGHEGTKTDTLRSFREHKIWDPLEVCERFIDCFI
jgi:NADH dehydrogenase [ubiquinone] 1 alpha subcomplex assembly factor 7